MQQWAIHSERVITPEGIRPATVLVRQDKILDIQPGHWTHPDFFGESMGHQVIMPGLIDSHVHINEPGRTDWEGFTTATRAAAAGGITTLVDMPLNSSPVTVTPGAFEEKLRVAEDQLWVNCGFWGGIVPENSGKIEDLLKSGVLGIKAFLTHSGIDEFPNVEALDLRKAAPVIGHYEVPLLAHAEIDSAHPDAHFLEEDPTAYRSFLKSRPRSWEDQAITLLIDLCREYRHRTHIVHLSAATSIPAIESARAAGLPLTVETCPHYLYFKAEDIPDKDTRFKCAPPIREGANNDQLWAALARGTIDFVVTDHSPAPPDMKKTASGNLKEAWGGIASLQFLLPVFWTAARKKGFDLVQLSRLLSRQTAAFIGLGERKGQLKAGFDADITVWDPDARFTIHPQAIHHKHKVTPYLDHTLEGLVTRTYVKGRKVYDQGEFVSLPTGDLILRS